MKNTVLFLCVLVAVAHLAQGRVLKTQEKLDMIELLEVPQPGLAECVSGDKSACEATTFSVEEKVKNCVWCPIDSKCSRDSDFCTSCRDMDKDKQTCQTQSNNECTFCISDWNCYHHKEDCPDCSNKDKTDSGQCQVMLSKKEEFPNAGDITCKWCDFNNTCQEEQICPNCDQFDNDKENCRLIELSTSEWEVQADCVWCPSTGLCRDNQTESCTLCHERTTQDSCDGNPNGLANCEWCRVTGTCQTIGSFFDSVTAPAPKTSYEKCPECVHFNNTKDSAVDANLTPDEIKENFADKCNDNTVRQSCMFCEIDLTCHDVEDLKKTFQVESPVCPTCSTYDGAENADACNAKIGCAYCPTNDQCYNEDANEVCKTCEDFNYGIAADCAENVRGYPNKCHWCEINRQCHQGTPDDTPCQTCDFYDFGKTFDEGVDNRTNQGCDWANGCHSCNAHPLCYNEEIKDSENVVIQEKEECETCAEYFEDTKRCASNKMGWTYSGEYTNASEDLWPSYCVYCAIDDTCIQPEGQCQECYQSSELGQTACEDIDGWSGNPSCKWCFTRQDCIDLKYDPFDSEQVADDYCPECASVTNLTECGILNDDTLPKCHWCDTWEKCYTHDNDCEECGNYDDIDNIDTCKSTNQTRCNWCYSTEECIEAQDESCEDCSTRYNKKSECGGELGASGCKFCDINLHCLNRLSDVDVASSEENDCVTCDRANLAEDTCDGQLGADNKADYLTCGYCKSQESCVLTGDVIDKCDCEFFSQTTVAKGRANNTKCTTNPGCQFCDIDYDCLREDDTCDTCDMFHNTTSGGSQVCPSKHTCTYCAIDDRCLTQGDGTSCKECKDANYVPNLCKGVFNTCSYCPIAGECYETSNPISCAGCSAQNGINNADKCDPNIIRTTIVTDAYGTNHTGNIPFSTGCKHCQIDASCIDEVVGDGIKNECPKCYQKKSSEACANSNGVCEWCAIKKFCTHVNFKCNPIRKLYPEVFADCAKEKNLFEWLLEGGTWDEASMCKQEPDRISPVMMS